MEDKDNDILEPRISGPEPKLDVRPKPSDLETEADIKTKVGIEVAGSSLSDEQKAKLENIVNLSHKRGMDRFEPDSSVVSEIINNKNKELSDRDMSLFNTSMEALDPARDSLNEYVDKFNNKAKELGADKIINDMSLPEKEKKEQLDRLFEENPEFAEIRDIMIQKQLNYRNIHKRIEGVINNFIERDGNIPKNIVDRQKEIEGHSKGVQQPQEGLSSVSDKIAQSIIAIKDKIKKCFNKIFGKENKNEVEGLHKKQIEGKEQTPGFS